MVWKHVALRGIHPVGPLEHHDLGVSLCDFACQHLIEGPKLALKDAKLKAALSTRLRFTHFPHPADPGNS